jgi:tetratricopeptide (TPR) repeat protein
MALRLDWRRAALYGVATPIIGWLLWARFCYEPAPEFGQLLSQINANLRLANSIPARDKDGNPVAAHEQLLAAAERDIALASREQKDSAVLAEFDGFARSLRGDFAGAAERYRVARTLPDCAEDQRTVLSFNEARMLRSSGNLAQALQVLTESQQSFSGGYAAQCLVERAELMIAMSQRETGDGSAAKQREARSLLQQSLGTDQPMAWAQAGDAFASIGDDASADAAWARAADSVPIANLRRSRLKLRAGDVDTALQLFERAAKAAPAETRRLVREDPAAWQAIAEDARFVQLVDPKAAAPVR